MSQTTQTIQSLIETLTLALEDAGKFDRGQDAAGKRLRAVLQEVKSSCQDARLSIQEIRNSKKQSKTEG